MHISSILFFVSISYTWVISVQSRKQISPRIIDGETALPGQFPWQARLKVIGDRFSWDCGGSIIDEQWILTAAHCLDGSAVLSLYIGDDDELAVPGGYIIHEDYERRGLLNDIALVQFMEFTKEAQDRSWKIIPLASDNLDVATQVTVIGWGETGDGSYGLHYATLFTIENSICDKIYGEGTIMDEMVCALSETSIETPCFGDAGGPLVVNATDNPVLVGIVSFFGDSGCYDGYPSAYTRVASYRNWIKSKIGI